jgi:rod shape-determining protein MreD
MKNSWLVGTLTFAIGWTAQVLLFHFHFPAGASPHWLLLTVLAFGGLGMTDMAQTLGFFWGLSLDVYGMSLFGTQGLLLAVAGFTAGRFSKQLNADKLATQETLAFLGTAWVWICFPLFDHIFRRAGFARDLTAGQAIMEFLLNAAIAPVVFWLVARWVEFWKRLLGEVVVHV